MSLRDHAVGETEDHEVLDGFLAEIVVNAENLFFGEDFFKFFVQLLCGREVMAEGFFHDDAGPLAVFFLGQANLSELLDDHGKEVKRHGQVVEEIALRAVLLLRLRDLVL
jgi:hypothetical protein